VKTTKNPLRGTGWVVSPDGKPTKVTYLKKYKHGLLHVTGPRRLKGESYSGCFPSKATTLRRMVKDAKGILHSIEENLEYQQRAHSAQKRHLEQLEEELKSTLKRSR
jgi:hypothetical protein